VATAEIMGADMAYMGTRFLATVEANIADDYQDMMINSSASDILYTPKILGVNASYMRQSVVDAGIDPTDLTPKSEVDFDDELELATQNSSEQKAWRDIWSAGQGVGSIDKVL
jgi:nitronate monooxygenase